MFSASDSGSLGSFKRMLGEIFLLSIMDPENCTSE